MRSSLSQQFGKSRPAFRNVTVGLSACTRAPAAEKARLKADIARIDARGSTALHAGWLEGGVQVASHLAAGHLNRVILFTDGQANKGEARRTAIASDIRGLASRGVSTSTLGVGAGYNEDLLEAMARAGDSNYYFIESPSQLPSLFEAELRGLLATLGRSVSFGLEPGPGVEILEVDTEAAAVARNDRAPAPGCVSPAGVAASAGLVLRQTQTIVAGWRHLADTEAGLIEHLALVAFYHARIV